MHFTTFLLPAILAILVSADDLLNMSQLQIKSVCAFHATLPSSRSSRTSVRLVLIMRQVAHGGTGCPQDTSASAVFANTTTLIISFDGFNTSIGPDVPITENRKNCQLNIDLSYPSGTQFSVLSSDSYGYAALDSGVTATQKNIYYFSGDADQVCRLALLRRVLS
jgi:hypothetical protein